MRTITSTNTAVLGGCGARETVATPKFDAVLYSGASLDDAMAFTEAPLDKRTQFKKSVRGTLADTDHLAIARGILHAREQQDGEAFRRLLHSESLNLLSQPTEEQMVHAMFQQVRAGEFLYAKENPKFFVTQGIPPGTRLPKPVRRVDGQAVYNHNFLSVLSTQEYVDRNQFLPGRRRRCPKVALSSEKTSCTITT